MTPHVLLIVRGFAADGPGCQLLDTLRALDPATVRVSMLALGAPGLLEAPLREAVAALGGTVRVRPMPWHALWRTAADIARAPWLDGVTHLVASLLRADFLAREISRRTRLPLITIEHGLHALGDAGRLARPLATIWYRHRWPAGMRLAAVSAKVAAQCTALGVPPRRVALVPNGIDLARFAPVADESARAVARAAVGLPAGVRRVALVCGGLVPGKRVDLAMRTVAAMDGVWHLLVAGDGPLRSELTDLAGRLGMLRRVTFAGALRQPELAYQSADLLLHPSAQESFGRVVAEAVACGLPALTRAGAGADLTAPPWPLAAAVHGDDPRTWAAAAHGLLSAWKDGKAGPPLARAHAISYYDIQQSARRLMELLRESPTP